MKRKQPPIGHFEARSVVLIASWTLVLAGAAYSQTTPATTSPSEAATKDRDVSAALREADMNRDGQLNREETLAMPSVWTSFDQIDTNKDNNISPDELARALQK